MDRVKASEKVNDDDPMASRLEGEVVRTIAELEVARLQRVEASSLLNPPPVTPTGHDNEDDPTLRKVA